RVTDALGNATTFTYDATGNQLSRAQTVTTPAGVQTLVAQTVYDRQGRAISTTDPDGNTRATKYDPFDPITGLTDGLNRQSQLIYTAQGKLGTVVLADGNRRGFTYDANGRALTSTDPAGRVTTSVYDPAGREVERIYPDETPDDLSDNPRTRT